MLSLPLAVATLVGLGLAFHLEMSEPDAAEYPVAESAAVEERVEWGEGTDLLADFEELQPSAVAGSPDLDDRRPSMVSNEGRVSEARRGTDSVESAVETLISSGADRSARRRAIDVLGTSDDPQAGPALLAALGLLEDEDLRAEVLLRLETRRDAKADDLLALSGAVGSDPEASRRLAELVAERLEAEGVRDAAAVLARAGSRANAAFIEAVLVRLDPAARVLAAEEALAAGTREARLEALGLLAGTDDAMARILLERLLLQETDPAVRVEVLDSLLEMNADPEGRVLRHLVEHDPSAEVRSVAASALVDADSEESRNLLAAALAGDPDPAVRAAAADALATAAAGDPSPSLMASLLSDPDDSVRAHAGRALAARWLLADEAVSIDTRRDLEDRLRLLADDGREEDVRGTAAAGVELLSRVRETS